MSDDGYVAGPYRCDDNRPAPFFEAKMLWAESAYEHLATIARDGEPTNITYGGLAEAIQRDTGVCSRQRPYYWIGRVLDLVARMCVANDEPQLTAYVVYVGTNKVGPGFAIAVEFAGRPRPVDLQGAAQHERARCHEYFSADEPGGWQPDRLPTSGSGGGQKWAYTEEVPEPKCPNCYTILPKTGRCYYCDD